MEIGEKYYTLYPHQPALDPWISERCEIDEMPEIDIIREWVYGDSPVFDDLAFQRCKIFTDKEECIKEARERLYALL